MPPRISCFDYITEQEKGQGKNDICSSEGKDTRNKRGWYPLDILTAFRDSEPKRAYYTVGSLRHETHVMKNFCLQKFFGGSAIKIRETKEDGIRWMF